MTLKNFSVVFYAGDQFWRQTLENYYYFFILFILFIFKIDHAQRKRIRKLCDEGSLSLKEEVSRKNHLLASKSAYLEEGLQPENNECSQTVIIVSLYIRSTDSKNSYLIFNFLSWQVVLRGPFSPLEMKIFGGTQCSVGKSIRIESTSVNSVLLDTNPSDSYER